MNFFEQQSLARRNSRVMVLLFLLAVAAIVLAVDLVLAGIYVVTVEEFHVPAWLYIGGALATAALIFTVSTINVSRLGGGGIAVARMVGARRVPPDTRDALERRLRNVVEEMAIASGVRMPEVYVMDDERGINAFAAGWDASTSVITVTRGTLEALTRDELQGVIGHEFSHILNGDIRLNVRMLGVLAGIVFIGSIGKFLMEGTRRSRSRDSANIALAGLALFIVGYVGLFFARLIKAAVSREREFLADASSVQFTRNPDGIAGALDQIRASPSGALITGRYAEELSHMFFGQGIKVWLRGLFDTHPSLDERIQRVRPGFQSTRYRTSRDMEKTEVPPKGRRSGDAGVVWGKSAVETAALVGALQGGKIDYAARLLAALPRELRDAVRTAEGASAAVVALLLAPKDEVMQQQLQGVAAALAERAKGMAQFTRALGPAFHLPVVDLALAALRTAPEEAKKELIAGLEAVIYADRRVSLHEFVVLTLVREQLLPPGKPAATTKKLAELKTEALTLLSLITHAGTRADAIGARQEALKAALRAGATEMSFGEEAATPITPNLESANAALTALKGLAPLQKALLVKGLFAAVLADGTIRVGEAELMRLVGAVIDCPLPPLLEELDPATLAM